ncbi:tetratricopeptide repeat protein [Allosphingosinicella flava]|uniref:Tetratricopeptide repeat protein n=1 Tax=Allosphingosinicella flava TaxID=2771430 RepID=A0A7T2GIT5_9SPHN|nr:tetratricopeptide repeat protein [Sphingosinicella flava]QPQ54658.1 tetratricopeptide repeat protein [Sphingosinicella flava]
MILSLLTAALLQTAAVPAPDGAYKNCLAEVRSAPAKAVETASDWRVKGGGLPARQCLGLAYVALERWQDAAVAYEQAAREAEGTKTPAAADFWTQSGNAWLAMNDAVRARAAFDAALKIEGTAPELTGEIHLDRARAGVALGDMSGARADIDAGLKLVPGDPFAWYLSAALALRENALSRAEADIAKALALAPDDADVLLQAGTIAGKAGKSDEARGFYERAAKADPNSEAGRAASAALADGAPPQSR